LTQFGLESQVRDNLHLFSRYRMEGAMSGERGQATIGLKNRFQVSEDLTSTFTAEKLSTVSGLKTDDYTAFTTGWLYTPGRKLYKVKGDYEIRLEPQRYKHLLALGAIKKISERWSGLLKGDLWYTDEKNDIDRVKGGATAGFSYRPRISGPLTLLSLLKTNYEKNSPAHPGAVDKEFVLMTEANYVLDSRWELEGKFASRWVKNTFNLYTASSSTFMYQAQLIRLLGDRYDISLSARVVHQRETGTVRYGGGMEAGRIMARNIWVGAGYDFGGHRDEDSAINEFTRNGLHIGMKWKFNEKLLEYFQAGK
ncbi:MAG: hypothetical protein JXB45_07505, partial [Candidatus Krumholzibacteriota bacterium]|nr:hypothetical protein [Candidatus Krumholzibacteriota bacterium]